MHTNEKNDSCENIVEHLIVQVREGNQGAFSELLTIYDPLFSSLLAKARSEELSAQDIEDLRQELAVVFFHSILSYDLDQEDVKFGLYAKICMRNALITQLRKLQKRNSPFVLYDGADDAIASVLDNESNPLTEITDRETVESMNKKIEATLSSFETSVWQMYLMGNSAKNIALALGKSEKSIENAICRLKRKLRDLFASEN